MIRLLLLGLFFYFAYSLVRGLLRALQQNGGLPAAKTKPRGEAMVLDPQCGTYIPVGDALSQTIKGEKHYFCSRECRDAYSQRS